LAGPDNPFAFAVPRAEFAADAAAPFDFVAGLPLLAVLIAAFADARPGERVAFRAEPVLDLAFST